MDLTFEQWLTLLVTIGSGTGVVWTFLAKTYFPARQKLRELEAQEAAKQRDHERELQRREAEEAEKQRAHERGIQKDRLEHDQDVELRARNSEALQASWREDKIAELLEKDSSFIREDLREGMGAIKASTSQISYIHSDVQKIKLDQRNMRADFLILLNLTQELHESWKNRDTDSG